MIKLGIIGISYGNGHPYSWAAIFNGFDEKEMSQCPFPVIPEYLSKQNFPKDFLSDLGTVSHIWTQDFEISKQIAMASKIEYVVNNIEDLCNNVDAILLARDDAENHFEMSKPFLNSGLPIFIDKPFALTLEDANAMLLSQKFESQIFTCSSLRYAKELILNKDEIEKLGHIYHVEGTIMNKWETYGIHILEPLVSQLPNRGKLIDVKTYINDDIHTVNVKWENCEAVLKVTGIIKSDLSISFSGNNNIVIKKFNDSFSCFRSSLCTFIDSINNKKIIIDRRETLELVEILQKGRL
ncbi:Gfo/Idh/MocA family oxidoreductase [Flavobacterium sp. CLA17]|uniref:Gfo/Idh/MocA family oxidoreductase n=1 Tax=Flavobacterium sp. CLA17 TaxID=2724135 RepID=UPI0014918F8A|nr:Gfo/Idh/MocA family oxidoreductase [Flavobacterium sp. CLA17]QSB27953.1 Gfo/Idh/MocA family oxidoreductase [Flavobacterium sp. CLA17]